MPWKTILIVDDDPDQAQLLSEILAGEGRRVLAFADPVRALTAVTNEKPDLLIADLAMPWIGGEAMVAEARERRAEMGIFLISGHPNGEQVAARHGLRFFAKPLQFASLMAAVREVLGEGAVPENFSI